MRFASSSVQNYLRPQVQNLQHNLNATQPIDYDYLLVIVLKIKSHSAAAHDDKCRLAYLYTYFFTYRIRPYSVHTTHT